MEPITKDNITVLYHEVKTGKYTELHFKMVDLYYATAIFKV